MSPEQAPAGWRTFASFTSDAMLPAMRAAFFLVSPVRSRRPRWMTGSMSACGAQVRQARVHAGVCALRACSQVGVERSSAFAFS